MNSKIVNPGDLCKGCKKEFSNCLNDTLFAELKFNKEINSYECKNYKGRDKK